jgi:hypothetical protein
MREHGDPLSRHRPLAVQRLQQNEDERLLEPGAPRDPHALIALQKSAGNRAVAELFRPTVQRCGPGGCADCGPNQETGAEQGMEGVVDEPPLMSEQTIQRTADGPRPVQRVATFANRPVHQTNSLADTVVNGTPVGVTIPVMNGTITTTGAQFQSALAKPTLTTAAAASGGFDSEVTTVPTNTGSFDETVLSAGPWRIATTKAFFHGLFPAVAGCGGPGATTLRAYGDPDDAAMQAANRRHEDHHATDVRAAFTDIIVPWDQKVTAAKAAGTKFHGASAAAAEAALWAAMGGTPLQIANAFVTRFVNDTNTFHGTPAGGPVSLSPTKQPGARNNCSLSWVHLVNPS